VAPRAIADPPEAVHLDYTAPDGCPRASDFAHQIVSRTKRASLVDESEASRTFIVSVTQGTSGLQATLGLRDAEGNHVLRRISGSSCEDVVRAAALIVVLAIDPSASLEEHAEETEPAPAPPPAPPTPPPVAPATEAPAPPPPAAESPNRWSADVAAALVATAGVAPVVAYGTDVSARIRSLADGVIAPSFALGARAVLAPSVTTLRGVAHFESLAADVSLCPLRLPASATIAFRPCAGGQLGELRAWGTNTPDHRTVTPLWIAGSGSARVEWRPRESLPSFEAEGGVLIPFRRSGFFFDPDTRVYKTPPSALFGTIGIAIRIL
jgi:hypothetical protein